MELDRYGTGSHAGFHLDMRSASLPLQGAQIRLSVPTAQLSFLFLHHRNLSTQMTMYNDHGCAVNVRERSGLLTWSG